MIFQILIPTHGLGLVLGSLVGLLIFGAAQFLYQGFSMRLRFRRMKAQGLPVPEPHSFLLGHLPLMMSLKRGLPKDAHDTYAQRRLTGNWPEYFPGYSKCPHVIYLDLWPFLSYPLMQATSAEACYQMTQQRSQPRHPMFGWAIAPVTRGRDLISMDIPTHRVWRSMLNPGFSVRNLTSHIPILTEEVEVFVQGLREKAGSNGTYGAAFGLYDRTAKLTFDIIMRTAVDLRVNEQTSGPGPMLKAIRQLITHVKGENIKSRLERLMPGYRRDVSRNTAIIDGILRPHIQSRFGSEAADANRRTVIDLALGQFRLESKGDAGDESPPPPPEFINTVISQLKLFIFAGHDTTSQAMCWVLHEVYTRPEVLDQVRREVSQVLGPNAKSLLTQKPHHLNELRYTTAVIKETLRLNPLASTHRQGSDGFSIVIEGTTYPTFNALMTTSPTAVHLRSDLWPRATEFLPERFMVLEGHPLHPAKNAWRAFELGSTRCIGEELAMMEMKLVLALTVGELDVEFAWDDRMSTSNQSTPPDMVDGRFMYRTGDGIGTVKDGLPTRVRVR
ncbi:cytochrome P450 [Nemania sp. FL0031]|nr:cytochrome P450 [Nemania sp. FL0031]